MAISPRAIAALVALTLLPIAGFLLFSGKAPQADAQGTPVVASPNVTRVANLPGTSAIAGVFSRSAPFFYVSGLESISVIDVSDPKAPKLAGKLANPVFENEAMTLGEREGADGKIQRFILVGNDLAQASVGPGGDNKTGRIGGRELIIVDVTNPASPRILSRTPSTGTGSITTSTHTVACMNPSCSVAYTAGSTGNKFSILDLSDLTQPREVKTVVSPAGHANPPEFDSPAGHHWQVDGAGLALHAGAGGTAIFDITDAFNPQVINGTTADGRKSPFNDFIHHNVQRPNAKAFGKGKAPNVTNGNVALITEEDYANEGDEVVCSNAGTFQTWEVPDLDGAEYRASNPKSEPDKGSIRVLDTIQAPQEAGGGLSTPVGGFCSAHWFDFHPSGIVAIGYYQQGLRLIDTRNAKDLKQFGFFTGGASEVWDAYWAPQRDAKGAVLGGKKTNLVYTVDAVQGVGVFEVTNLPPDLPISGDDSRGAFPSQPGNVAQDNAKLGSEGSGSGAGGSAGQRFQCTSRRQITITVPKVGNSRLKSVRVTVNGKRHRGQLRGRKSVRVSLATKLKGRYTVKVTGVTRSGKRVSTTRYYRTCTPKGTPLPAGAPKSKIKG